MEPTSNTRVSASPDRYVNDQKLSVGQIVHFVSGGNVRPAIVVRVWHDSYANLQVFFDGSNDGHPENVVWETSVKYDSGGSFAAYDERSFHWPPRA
jgi:hypothetical protein